MNLRCAALFALATTALAADLPYVGKWKQNVAKSDFGQSTITYESLPGGEWKASAFGITYTFKMDGKDYSDGMGGLVSWKAVDANTWETTAKANGKVVSSDTLKLSADGKNLTDSSKANKPSGGTMDNMATYTRLSGGPGLAGKWKTQKFSGDAGTIEFVSSAANGLAFKDSDMGMSCDGKLDGKDYPCNGPNIPPGFTVTMKNMPPRSLEINVKKDGKLFFKATYTVDAAGKTMVETGGPVSVNEVFKIAFDKM